MRALRIGSMRMVGRPHRITTSRRNRGYASTRSPVARPSRTQARAPPPPRRARSRDRRTHHPRARAEDRPLDDRVGFDHCALVQDGVAPRTGLDRGARPTTTCSFTVAPGRSGRRRRRTATGTGGGRPPDRRAGRTAPAGTPAASRDPSSTPRTGTPRGAACRDERWKICRSIDTFSPRVSPRARRRRGRRCPR